LEQATGKAHRHSRPLLHAYMHVQDLHARTLVPVGLIPKKPLIRREKSPTRRQEAPRGKVNGCNSAPRDPVPLFHRASFFAARNGKQKKCGFPRRPEANLSGTRSGPVGCSGRQAHAPVDVAVRAVRRELSRALRRRRIQSLGGGELPARTICCFPHGERRTSARDSHPLRSVHASGHHLP
jgi:hypothetical protein